MNHLRRRKNTGYSNFDSGRRRDVASAVDDCNCGLSSCGDGGDGHGNRGDHRGRRDGGGDDGRGMTFRRLWVHGPDRTDRGDGGVCGICGGQGFQ